MTLGQLRAKMYAVIKEGVPVSTLHAELNDDGQELKKGSLWVGHDLFFGFPKEEIHVYPGVSNSVNDYKFSLKRNPMDFSNADTVV